MQNDNAKNAAATKIVIEITPVERLELPTRFRCSRRG
jgi:hypothetical protein